MKNFLFLIFVACLYNVGLAQDKKTYTINSLQQNTEELTRRVNRYPAFIDGKVVFKDSAFAAAKMNLNRLSGQVLFIRPKGDTLMLAHPETIDKVVIGTDTFHYFDGGFLERITHFNSAPNLYALQKLKLIGREKKGPYGTYSSTSSANSNSTFTNDDQVTQSMTLDENTVYKYDTDYYLSDRFRNFFPASKNRFYKIFFKHEKQVEEYIKTNKTDFNKKADLLALIQYAHSL